MLPPCDREVAGHRRRARIDGSPISGSRGPSGLPDLAGHARFPGAPFLHGATSSIDEKRDCDAVI